MALISSMKEFGNIVNKLGISAVYLFIGNGAKLQYDNMENVKTVLGPVIEDLDRNHGAGQWLAVYGGDIWVEDSPDLGACMYWIKKVYKPYTMAVQGWMEHDEFVDYVYIYEEEKDDEGRTLYGGVRDGKLLGGSKVYLGAEFRKYLTGIISIDAKGRVGTQELDYARKVGVQITKVEPALQKYEY